MNKWLALLLLSLALLTGATALARVQRAQEAKAFDSSPLPAHHLPNALGVNVALERYDAQQRAAMLDAIASAGFGWVRQRFPWDQAEPVAGVYDWGLWDAIVADVAARDLELVAVLDGSPAWARSQADAANALAPPASRAPFGRFAAAFAERYGASLRFYQVWDEPNIAPHWGSGLVDAADYAGLLREAAVQLRSIDSDAVIVLAALAPTLEPGGLNQSDLSYLDALYAAGAAPWFDAVASQPYGFDRPPDDPPSASVLNFRRAELLRQVMASRDDAETPVWLAAYGWHSDAAPTGPWPSVDSATQATWAVDALEWARRHWSWTAGVAWAAWQPAQPVGDTRWGFALVTPDNQPTPTLDALSGWASDRHPLGPGAVPPNAPAVEAEGGWRLSSQAADPPHGAESGNNRLRIPFEGSALALDVQRGPFWGYLDVTVDGQPANALPQDGAGRAYLVLHDPLGQQASVVVARNLDPGVHVAEISASGGWEQWPLLALRVAGDSTAGGASWPVWLLGLGGAALAGWAIAGLHRQRQAPTAHGQAPRSIFAAAERIPPAIRYMLLAGLALAVVVSSGPLQLVVLGLLFALLVVFPAMGLALLAATAPLFLVAVPIFGRPFSPAEATVWLLAAALVARRLIDAAGVRLGRETGSSRVVRSPGRLLPLDWPVLALLAVALLSLAAADNLGVGLRELRTVIVAGVLAYGLVRLAPAGVDGLFDPWPVVWGLGLGAAAVAGWGVYQAVGGVGLIDAEGVWRVRGPFGSPNNLALYLGHTLPILLAVAVFGRGRGRRLMAGLLAGLVFLGLALTFSKGALLLALPAALLVMGFVAGGRWRWVALGLLAVGALALLPLFGTERFAGLFDLQGGTTFFRVQLWRGAWNMVTDQPWLGVGLDNFLYAYRTRYVLPTAWQELNLSHPHNVVLDFWTRLGFAGLVVGVWLFGAAMRQNWLALRRATGDQWALLLGLLASLVATLIHGLIDNSVFLVDLMLLFMLSIGIIARLGRELEEAKGVGEPRETAGTQGNRDIPGAEPASVPPGPSSTSQPVRSVRFSGFPQLL